MTPDLSRRLATILGRHWVYPAERDRVISAALSVENFEDLPADARALIDQIQARGASEPNG